VIFTTLPFPSDESWRQYLSIMKDEVLADPTSQLVHTQLPPSGIEES